MILWIIAILMIMIGFSCFGISALSLLPFPPPPWVGSLLSVMKGAVVAGLAAVIIISFWGWLKVRQNDTMLCSHCRERVKKKWEICPHCGTLL